MAIPLLLPVIGLFLFTALGLWQRDQRRTRDMAMSRLMNRPMYEEEPPPVDQVKKRQEDLAVAIEDSSTDDIQEILAREVDDGNADKTDYLISKVRGQWQCAISGALESRKMDIAELLCRHITEAGGTIDGKRISWHDALSGRTVEAVRFMVDHGADVNAMSPVDAYPNQTATMTPLITAARRGMPVEVLSALIEAGADVNATTGPTSGAGSAIFAALVAKNYDIARLLLKHGAVLKMRGGRFDNILQIACMITNSNMVAASLQDKVVSVDVRGGLYDTPLQAACAVGAADCAKVLLDNGANVHLEGGKYGTALQAAAASGSAECIKMLLDHGAVVYADGTGGRLGRPLQLALERGHGAAAEAILERVASFDFLKTTANDPGEQQQQKQQPQHKGILISACISGKASVVKMLLDLNLGLDVNEVNNEERTPDETGPPYRRSADYAEDDAYYLEPFVPNNNACTPLWAAVWANEGTEITDEATGTTTKTAIEMVKLLLDHGADPNLYAKAYRTPLMQAIVRGDVPVVRLLLDRGADPNLFNPDYRDGETALTLAATRGGPRERYGKDKGSVEITRLLLERGAKADAVTRHATSALSEALQHNEDEEVGKAIATLLIERGGADVNQILAKEGTTALSRVCHYGPLSYIEFLVTDLGANVNAPTPVPPPGQPDLYKNEGTSSNVTDATDVPLCEAALNGHMDIVRFLLDHGSNVHTRSPRGTALQAAYYGRQENEKKSRFYASRKPNAPKTKEEARENFKAIEALLQEHGAEGPMEGGKFGMFDMFVRDIANLVVQSAIAEGRQGGAR
ncbi:Ankyrin repeat domain-containing protein 17 [Sporothrix eucalyptigena]